MNDTLPLDFWPLKVNEETESPAGSSQVIDTLCSI